MALKKVFLVFVLPVVFSVLFGSVVMAGILIKPERESDLSKMSYSGGSSKIIGFSNQYPTFPLVEIQAKIPDSSSDCRGLSVAVPSSEREFVTQDGFEQHFEPSDELFPPGKEFSQVADSSGTCEMTSQTVLPELGYMSTGEKFTIK